MGTHGRGVIIIDDISPLREINETNLSNKLYFLKEMNLKFKNLVVLQIILVEKLNLLEQTFAELSNPIFITKKTHIRKNDNGNPRYGR